MTKNLKNLIGAIIFSGLLFAMTIIFLLKHINVDLSKTNQIKGGVIDAGVTSTASKVGGKYRVEGKIFYILLDNSTEGFATYRPKQDYSRLSQAIKPGDIVTIHYLPSNSKGLNLDVYQITKNGQILQDYSSYNRNYKFVVILTGISSFGILAAGIYPYFRKWRRKKALLKKQSS